jgi:hypothetical protein
VLIAAHFHSSWRITSYSRRNKYETCPKNVRDSSYISKCHSGKYLDIFLKEHGGFYANSIFQNSLNVFLCHVATEYNYLTIISCAFAAISHFVPSQPFLHNAICLRVSTFISFALTVHSAFPLGNIWLSNWNATQSISYILLALDSKSNLTSTARFTKLQ